MKNNKGFSLVELIVVIAIMAILAAVAVAGFSIYIPKAQQAADEQLVHDVEQALRLAMQSGDFEDMPVGKLVLSTEGIKLVTAIDESGNEVIADLDSTSVGAALRNAFGNDYQTKIKLKYEKWDADSLVSGIQKGEAGAVLGSSYLTGDRSELLLQDVEKFTDMAANLAGAMGTYVEEGTTLSTLYGQELLDATALKYDIKVTDEKYMKADGSGKVDWDKWGEDHPQEFSNLLVLAAAKDSAENAGTENMSTATGLIMGFSTYYGFAATCPEFSPVLTAYLDAMSPAETAENYDAEKDNYFTMIDVPTSDTDTKVYKVKTPADGAEWKRQLEAELAKEYYENDDGETYAEYASKNADTNELNGAAAEDQIAFMQILASMNNVSKDDIAGDLDNANLFTEGAVKDKYDLYMGTLDVMNGYGGDFSVNPGEIAIIYNQESYSIINTLN